MPGLVPDQRRAAEHRNIADHGARRGDEADDIADDEAGQRPECLGQAVDARGEGHPHAEPPHEKPDIRPRQPDDRHRWPALRGRDHRMNQERQHPGGQPDIGGGQHDHAERRPPIAHPHPVIGQCLRTSPAGPVPARQRDPGHPARLLPDGGVEGRREERPHRDQRARIVDDPRKPSGPAELRDPQPELILYRRKSYTDPII
jgi:hypothetical protein